MTTCSRTSSRTSTARATLAATRRASPAAACRSAAAARSRRPDRSILGVVLLPPAQLGDCVEDGGGHLGLGGARDPVLAGGRDDRDLVLARVEPDVAARDVVEHHRVEPLVRQLAPGVLEAILAVLGGEAHQDLVPSPAPGQAGEDVLRALQLELQTLHGALLDLLVEG